MAYFLVQGVSPYWHCRLVCWVILLGTSFIYHVEADEQPEPARKILKNQYQIMEKRLYNIITTPGW